MSARILKLPRTIAGRELLRQAAKDRGTLWDCPGGIEAVDWDASAMECDRMLRDLYPEPGQARR